MNARTIVVLFALISFFLQGCRKNLMLLLLLGSCVLFVACPTATTRFIVKKLVPVVRAESAPDDSTTMVATELQTVFEIEVTENTLSGTSRTTIPQMTRGYVDVKTGEFIGAGAQAIREDGDRLVEYAKEAPLPGNPNDWRQITTLKGFPLYRSTAGQWFYKGGYINEFKLGILGISTSEFE